MKVLPLKDPHGHRTHPSPTRPHTGTQHAISVELGINS
jgi:hypothetical protein